MKKRNIILSLLCLVATAFLMTSISAENAETDIGGSQENSESGDIVPDSSQSSLEQNHETVTQNQSPVTYSETDIPIDQAHFEDANFCAYVKEFDTNNDDHLSEQERSIVTIEVTDKNISSLKGIEYFPWITTLKCSGNQLSTLDLSQNLEINTIICSRNPLINLDFTYLSKLKSFTCDNSSLQSIKVPSSLGSFNSKDTQLKIIDLSQCKNLYQLAIQDLKQLQTLTFSPGITFNYFVCQNTGLTSLDLTQVTCYGNIWLDNNPQLERINTNGSKIGTFSAVNCDLKSLDLTNTQITKLLKVNDNKNLTEIKMPNTTFAATIHAYNCNLNSMDLSRVQTNEVWLNFNYNLQSIQFSDQTQIQKLYAKNCNLKKLDISSGKITNLLIINDNKNLTEIKMPNTSFTADIHAYNCNLKTMDLSHVQANEIWLNDNPQFDTVQLGNLTDIDKLYLHRCDFKSLDISNINIQHIWLTENKQLSKLITGNNSYLESLYCTNCALPELDLTNNPNLSVKSVTPQNLTEEKLATVNLEKFYITLDDHIDLSKINHLSEGRLNRQERRIYFDKLPQSKALVYSYQTGTKSMDVNIPLYIPYHEVTLEVPGFNSQVSLVDEEGYYTIPDAPILDGYIFEGWYLDEQYQNAYNNEKIKEKTILYAKYAKAYQVTFIHNEHQITETVKEGERIQKPQDPIIENYQFKGWYLSDGTLWNFDQNTVNRDIELYAQFQKYTDQPDNQNQSNSNSSQQGTPNHNNQNGIQNRPVINADRPMSREEYERMQKLMTGDEQQGFGYAVLLLVSLGIGIGLIKTARKVKR